MILIDLQTLLAKFNCNKLVIGFSYLSYRSFIVNIENNSSDPGDLNYGSIYLFFYYVNDMPQAIECDLLLYADDSVIEKNKK